MDAVLPAAVLLLLVAALVLRPLVAGSTTDPASAARRADLQAAKEAKYREIKDAELDFRMGKLSEADWRALDRELRAQAIEILREIDRIDAEEDAPGER